MGFRYPQPDNEDDFEKLCIRFYRKIWRNETLAAYGKRGERQDGVDIHDPLSTKPVSGIQCKHHEPTKTLPPAEIKSEVAKAEKSSLALERYVIATTARKSRNAQDTVVELNQRSDKKFTVEICFWEDICERVGALGRVTAEIIIYGDNILAGAIPGIGLDVLSNSATASTAEMPGKVEPFATIERLLDERRFDAARHELESFCERAESATLPASEQYMLRRLQGKLALESGEIETAGSLFLDAYLLNPEVEQAKLNQVFGYLLIGDHQKAYERATSYVSDGVTNPAMVVHLINSASSPKQLGDHSILIGELADSHEDINTALAHQYLQFNDIERADASALKALRINPESPFAHFAVGLCAHHRAVSGRIEERQTHFQRALMHYDAAAVSAAGTRGETLLPDILANRALAKHYSGIRAGVVADFLASAAAAKSPSIYAERAVRFCLQEDDLEGARGLLDYLDPSRPESQLLLLHARCRTAEEKKAHLPEMLALVERDWPGSMECRFHGVQWALDVDDVDAARQCVPPALIEAHLFQFHVLQAWICISAQKKDQAQIHATHALNVISPSAQAGERRVLAHVLIQLKDDECALGLLEQVATPGVLNEDTKALLNCAERLGRHDLVLRLAREIRMAGVRDDKLLRRESQLLIQYAPLDALTLADTLVAEDFSRKYFVAVGNMIAARLSRLDRLQLEEAALPGPSELSPNEAPLVLFPYLKVHKYEQAIKFLYRQKRAYFEDQQVHARYIFIFLSHAHQTQLVQQPSSVQAGTAVLLESVRGERRWIILEDNEPVASRSEFSASSTIGQCVLGSKVGDEVQVPGGLGHHEACRVTEVQTKYVRAFQDSLENFEKRFPGTTILQQMHVGTEDEFDLTELIASLRSRRECLEDCFRIYRENVCPLHLLANRIGSNEMEAIKALVAQPNGFVRCCATSSSEFESAAGLYTAAGEIVLTVSAVVTLALLDAWHVLDSAKTYYLSQHAYDLIDVWIYRADAINAKEGGVAYLDQDGQFAYRERTDKERETRASELRAIRDALTAHCSRASSAGMASISSDRRDNYQRALGHHDIDAICIAHEKKALLWCDDMFASIIAQADFGVARVWTQAAILGAVGSELVTRNEYESASAKLLAWKYMLTYWRAETVLAAAEIAGWDRREWPLAQCVETIGKLDLPIAERARIAAGFLPLLRHSKCPELLQTGIIQACLSSLANRKATEWMLEHVDQMCGLDVASAEFIRMELQYWLETH